MRNTQLDRLLEFLRFPSISTDRAAGKDVHECAQWLVAELGVIGLTASLMPTEGHPVVIARNAHRAGRPTVLIYGHYDVQPVDEPARRKNEPLDPNKHWLTRPFEPQITDGVIYARGSTDNKGQIFAHITGVAETIAAEGDLPVNLVVLIEGEEEIGSQHLEGFLENHRRELQCDVIAISDTGMVARGIPTLSYGLRGIVAMELRVNGPESDLHSGGFGGAVMNPATAVARLVATLHDADGRITVPGFYNEVLPLEEWERLNWGNLSFGDADLQRLTGVKELAGEPGYTGLERLWGRPTAEVNGIGGGFQGEGTKTVIPREAFAKLTFRLVPDQDPAIVAKRIQDHLRNHCPRGVTMEVITGHSGQPYVTDPNSRFGQAAQRALMQAFPSHPLALVREGGSIPIVNTFKRVLGVESLLLGLALPDCKAHAPNENFPLENFYAGARLNRALLKELAAAR
jgi:acetylornithine deacetylase/succinyl-diaminopimelate desuccinylase-like protein